MAKPYILRKARADMELAELDLKRLSRLASVPYTRCSEILNGHRNDTTRLNKLITVIERELRKAVHA
jgi:hypothetical protein